MGRVGRGKINFVNVGSLVLHINHMVAEFIFSGYVTELAPLLSF